MPTRSVSSHRVPAISRSCPRTTPEAGTPSTPSRRFRCSSSSRVLRSRQANRVLFYVAGPETWRDRWDPTADILDHVEHEYADRLAYWLTWQEAGEGASGIVGTPARMGLESAAPSTSPGTSRNWHRGTAASGTEPRAAVRRGPRQLRVASGHRGRVATFVHLLGDEPRAGLRRPVLHPWLCPLSARSAIRPSICT